MKRETLEELAMGHISDLVDQLVHHQSRGDEVSMAIVHQEIKDLTSALDSEEEDFFWSLRLRYLDEGQFTK